MNEAQEHHYEPLDKSHLSVRLISFDEVNGRICCTLHTIPTLTTFHDSNSRQHFIALSYTWGAESSPLREISLDGNSAMIRENLWLALGAIIEHRKENRGASLRYENISHVPSLWDDTAGEAYMHGTDDWRYFWIDALCIDQGNVEERSHQVNMMREIYSKASFVLVWLGEATNHSRLAIRTMSESFRPRSRFQTPQPLKEPKESDLISLSEKNERALWMFFEREYWKRVWIIQEIHMAKTVLIMCGNDAMRWNRIDDFVSRIMIEDNLAMTSAYMIVRERKDSNWRKANNIGVQLEILVERFYRQHCTDPRDKVFAVLGLANNVYLQADYSMSAKAVFNMVMASLGLENSGLQDAASIKEFREVLRLALELEAEPDAEAPTTLNVEDWYSNISVGCA